MEKVFFRCAGAFITAIVANYYLSIVFVIICGAFVALRGYYIKTARDIKRLEALGYYQYVIVN